MKYRKIILSLVSLLGIGFFGLVSKPAPATEAKPRKIHVVASVFPIYQFTRNVAKGSDDLDINILLSPSMGCPHDYSLTPQDIQKISRADVLIVNGMGLEEFMGQPIKRANPHVKVIDSSKGIKGLPAAGEKEEAGHKGHPHRELFNPHLFASPRTAARQVLVIGNSLAQIDPKNAELYKRNAGAYADKLNKLAAQFEKTVKAARSRKIVTMHEVFDYLAADTGLDVVAVIEEHPGAEPSAAKMLALVRKIKASGAAAVFTEPQYPAKVGRTIAREAGVRVDTLDPAASGPNNAPLDYYEKTMTKNLETLRKDLNAGKV